LVDTRRGVTKFLPNLPTQWRDVQVAEILSERSVAGLSAERRTNGHPGGEFTFGHGKSADTMISFRSEQESAGGVVVDRKLRLGPCGAAGELGHQTIQLDGPLCGCGNHGCLEGAR